MPLLLAQPDGDRLGDLLNRRLQEPQWTTFRAAVAFVKRSGVNHIADSLRAFARRGHIRMAVGVDLLGTSVEGLESLLECVGGQGEVWVFHNENGPTFHPKMYVFSNDRNAEVIIGSGNLTQGGLFENYEASIALALDLADPDDHGVLTGIEAVLNAYFDRRPGTAVALTAETLERLTADGYIVPEVEMRPRTRRPAVAFQEYGVPPTRGRLFRHVRVPPPPIPVLARDPSPRDVVEAPATFYMTLQQTDVGTGQTTAGAAPRSPEIFIPLAARDAAPDFWRWPEAFTEDAQRPGKRDRIGVPMRLDDAIVTVNMTYFGHRHDLRLRNETLRGAGTIGDVLRIERTDNTPDHDYSVSVIRQGAPEHAQALTRCAQTVRNSRKRWGYE